ncbi:MAG: hypothetical protein AAGH64_09315 [Planctomycetota bacterium]
MLSRTLITLSFLLTACQTLLAQSADYASISEESRRAIVLTLSLDEQQTETLDDLIDGYLVDAARITAEFGARILALEETETNRDVRFGLRKGLEVDRDRVLIANRDTLFDDLALVLDDEQSRRVEVARLRLVRAPMFE